MPFPHPTRFAARLLLLAMLCCATQLHAQSADWSVRVTPYNQVFPALDLSQPAHVASVGTHADPAQLGDGSGLVAVRVRARHDGERVQLTLAATPWLRAPTHLNATLAQAGRDYELHPRLDWDVPRLAAQSAATAATLQIDLQRDTDTTEQRRVAIDLRPLNDALYFVREGSDSVDLSWIFAAYADESGDVAQRILDVALQSGIVDKFTGYADADGATTDADAVLRQAWAVWDALAARGITYSSADPGIDHGPRVFSQRVRFVADTWNDRSANCIDGSVLLASALTRIGLRSFLVLVPGHTFVGFYTDAQSQHAAYLETTLLGSHPTPPDELPAYASAVSASTSTRTSLASFDAALRAGAARQARSAGKLDGRHRPDYAVIDITTARRFGIRPISIPGAGFTAIAQ